jgi:hypothetical protein
MDRRRRRDRLAWALGAALATVAVVGVVALVVRGAPAPVVPAMANPGGERQGFTPAPPPDLAGLSPRERFRELFDRLMRAGAEGDSITVANLSPLAVAAYGQLDSVTIDDRFHAGLIDIQTGNFAGARALADTIEARDPGHLFGPVLQAALARLEGDSAAFRQALERFRQRAGAELSRTDRPEYQEHRQLLNEVQHAAETP